MSEWSKVAVSKTAAPHGAGSSNLPLSARSLFAVNVRNRLSIFYLFYALF